MITEERIKELKEAYKLKTEDHGFLTMAQMKAIGLKDPEHDGYVTVFTAEVCGDTLKGASVIPKRVAEFSGDVATVRASEHLAFLEALDQTIRQRESIDYKSPVFE